MVEKYKEKLFFLDVRPEGPNSPEFSGNFKEEHKITGSLGRKVCVCVVEGFEGVFVDWYMLGEGDMIVHTAASSYGISAADRGNITAYPNRFVMGKLLWQHSFLCKKGGLLNVWTLKGRIIRRKFILVQWRLMKKKVLFSGSLLFNKLLKFCKI
jgi:hypothetical protein